MIFVICATFMPSNMACDFLRCIRGSQGKVPDLIPTLPPPPQTKMRLHERDLMLGNGLLFKDFM